MSVSTISAPRRFSLTLDPGLVLERLILTRLSGLTRKCTQEGLRALLVQGFLVESQWLRSERYAGQNCAAPATPTVPPTRFASWLEHADASSQRTHAPTVDPARAPLAAIEALTASLAESTLKQKPFAHLRKVIG